MPYGDTIISANTKPDFTGAYSLPLFAKKEKDINKLKILLANETTKILHGEAAAKKACQALTI